MSALPLPHFALSDAQLRNDALLAHALAAMKAGHDADALIAVESVCRHYPDKAIPALLRARIIDRCRPGLAAKAWYLAWACDPENPMLQDALLGCWLTQQANERVIELGRVFLPKRCRDGTHETLLHLLQKAGMARAGVCWINISGFLEGRIFHLAGAAPDTTVLRLADQDANFIEKIRLESDSFAFFRPRRGQVYSLAFDDGEVELFQGCPLIFPPTKPHFVENELNQQNQQPFHDVKSINVKVAKAPKAPKAVDIVVPVYRGFVQVRACLQSVLDSLPQNQTKARLIVVDDASPEPVLRSWLDQLAQKNGCVLIRNRYNLGFVETVNRGIRHHASHDVVLLNADTLVHGDWIDRLRQSLYAAPDIAAVTPWSNNGEISSFPQMVVAAPMPDLAELAQLDDAAAALFGSCQDVELPVCCGFTMMIKRHVLDQVGLLDGAGFHRGYGEEVDWCLRARAAGYRHSLAAGVFVAHNGGVSFGMEKTLRVRQNRAELMARYPDYYPEYGQFIRNDGLLAIRKALQQKLTDCAWLERAMTGMIDPGPVGNVLERVVERFPLPVFLAPPLSGGVRRVAVWHVPPESPAAAKVLFLARAIATRPQSGLRLLVFGPFGEALWHTGVVDGLPVQSNHKTLFSDQTLLGLSACIALLGDFSPGDFDALPYFQIDHAFDPMDWLRQLNTQDLYASDSDDLAQFDPARQQNLVSVF